MRLLDNAANTKICHRIIKLLQLRGTKQSLIYVISSIDCFVPRNDVNI